MANMQISMPIFHLQQSYICLVMSKSAHQCIQGRGHLYLCAGPRLPIAKLPVNKIPPHQEKLCFISGRLLARATGSQPADSFTPGQRTHVVNCCKLHPSHAGSMPIH